MLPSLLPRDRVPVDGEDNLTSALVIDEKVKLRAEFTGRADFEFTHEVSDTGREPIYGPLKTLRTEAAIEASAITEPEDGDCPGRGVGQAEREVPFSGRHATDDLKVCRSRAEAGASRTAEKAKGSRGHKAANGEEAHDGYPHNAYA